MGGALGRREPETPGFLRPAPATPIQQNNNDGGLASGTACVGNDSRRRHEQQWPVGLLLSQLSGAQGGGFDCADQGGSHAAVFQSVYSGDGGAAGAGDGVF
jgi:hypothetical protein